MRQASVQALCDDILVYSKQHHRDFRSVEIRANKLAAEFGDTAADKIKSAEIDAWLTKVTRTPSYRYCALFSLIFGEAVRKGKVASNPARLLRHTFCSRLAMRGENLNAIQQLAGHKTIQMSARYAHLGERSLHVAVSGF